MKEFNGVKVAIFGLSIDKMSDIANPDADTPFMTAIETAKATVAQIHNDGIKNIILLSHLGYEGDLELAEQVEGIGIIVVVIATVCKVTLLRLVWVKMILMVSK